MGPAEPTVRLWMEVDYCSDNGLNGANIYCTEAEAWEGYHSQAATHEEHGCTYEQLEPFSVDLPAQALIDLAWAALEASA